MGNCWYKNLSILLFMLCFSCATYIPIKVQKPATLDHPPFKTIAVLNFNFSGRGSFWFNKYNSRPIGGSHRRVRLHRGERGFHPQRSFPAEEVTSRLITALVKNGHYQILEQSVIHNILIQNSFTDNDFIFESKMIEIGKLAGVDAIVLGSGSFTIFDDGSWKEEKSVTAKYLQVNHGCSVKSVPDTIITRKFSAQRTISVEINYNLINVNSGLVMASETHNADTILSSEATTIADAFEKISDWKTPLKVSVQNIVDRAVIQIAPHWVEEKRRIMNGKTNLMKESLKLVKRGLLFDARNIWEHITKDNSSSVDHVAAYHNLAIYEETMGNYDLADTYFNKCYKLTGKTDYLKYRKEIQNRKENDERIKFQTK